MPGDGSVTTLDNLESQKQVKRTLQYIENRIDKIQNFLQEQDRSLHMNVLRDELQKEFRQVGYHISSRKLDMQTSIYSNESFCY